MIARHLLLMWLAGSLALSSASAQGPVSQTAATTWTRVTSADGNVGIEMPCEDIDIARAEDGASSAMMCEHGGIAFAVAMGPEGLGEDQAEEFGDFETMLNDARSDEGTESFKLLEVSGFRAFTATQGPEFGMTTIIDYRPGQPIILITMEAGEAGMVDSDFAKSLGERFLASVEVIGQ